MRNPSTPFVTALAVAAGLALVSTGADAASNVSKEVTTAATHSHFAGASKTLKMVHTHLHHTVNCLVGPNGAGFSSKFLDPCQGMGNGAVNDATDAKTKQSLQQALKIADKGLATDNLAMAQEDADLVHGILQKTAKDAM